MPRGPLALVFGGRGAGRPPPRHLGVRRSEAPREGAAALRIARGGGAGRLFSPLEREVPTRGGGLQRRLLLTFKEEASTRLLDQGICAKWTKLCPLPSPDARNCLHVPARGRRGGRDRCANVLRQSASADKLPHARSFACRSMRPAGCALARLARATLPEVTVCKGILR